MGQGSRRRRARARGALTNLQGRYEIQTREQFDDGWSQDAEEAQAWKTEIIDETAKSILTRNASPDLPFNVSLNPYRG